MDALFRAGRRHADALPPIAGNFSCDRRHVFSQSIGGDERIIEKNDIVFLPAKEYYQLINTGSGRLVLFGNRSEPFGVRPVRADSETLR